MRILTVHNRYLAHGGEDSVVNAEKKLLEQQGHTVELYEEFNRDIALETPFQKIHSGVRTIWSLSSHRELLERLKSQNYDLVHVHNTFPRMSPSIYWAAHQCGVPIVQSLHNYRWLCAASWLMRDGDFCQKCVGRSPLSAVQHACYRNSYQASLAVASMQMFHKLIGTFDKCIDAYITFTQFGHDVFIRGGLDPKRLFIKPHFSFPNDFENNSPSVRKKRMLYLGRVSEEKGADMLVAAWRKAKLTDWELWIVGDGPSKSRLIENNSDIDSLHFKGSIEHNEVDEVLKQSRFLIAPSMLFETFGLSGLEAYTRKTPVIAPNHGVFRELVDHGSTGLLYKSRDMNDLSNTLVRASTSSEYEWKKWSDNAFQSYLGRFTAERNLQMLLEIYQAAQMHNQKK